MTSLNDLIERNGNGLHGEAIPEKMIIFLV